MKANLNYALIIGAIFFSQACLASKLVSNYVMEHEGYIEDLVVRCFSRHVDEKSNAIDLEKGLPKEEIDTVHVGLSFAYPRVSVSFNSSENMLDQAVGLSCIFDRTSGDILGISSFNWKDAERDRFFYPPEAPVSQRYELWEDELYFGVELDYDSVLKILKNAKAKSVDN